MLAIVALLLTSACNAVEERASGGEANRIHVEERERSELSRISRRGTEYPYIRYSEVTGRAESHGQIFYLYPTTRLKTQLVAVDYEPGGRVEGIVEEEIFGSVGFVAAERAGFKIDFLPISLPRGVAAGQGWLMRYAGRDFTCRSIGLRGAPVDSNPIEVECSAQTYTLRFSFDRVRGVTQYQDFCDHSICTFRLIDSAGLLSPAMLRHIGMPTL